MLYIKMEDFFILIFKKTKPRRHIHIYTYSPRLWYVSYYIFYGYVKNNKEQV